MTEFLERVNDDFIDAMELVMTEMANEPTGIEHTHIFTPGLYARVMMVPAGRWITSKIHNTEHPFILSAGKIEVSIDGNKAQMIEAPYHGITLPGTRRLAYVHQTCIWTTFHPLPFIQGNENELPLEDQEKLLSDIEKIITEPYTNKLLQPKKQEELH